MEKEITFLLNMKLYELKRNHMPSLTFQQLRGVLYSTRWLKGVPARLNEMARDISSLSFEEVAALLADRELELNDDFDGYEGEEYEEEQL